MSSIPRSKNSLLLFAALLVFGPCVLAPQDAQAAHRHKHHVAKHAVKKAAAKKSAKPAKPKNTAPKAKAILGESDPNVAEPSEMITAIKNRAQDTFWNGKRPYTEQLQEQKSLQQAGLTGARPPAMSPTMSKPKTAENTDEMPKNDALRRVSFSELSGITFDDQPLRMNASDAFRRSLEMVSFELGRPCKGQEYFGWPMQQTEQKRVDRIFEETNEKFKLRGFSITPQRPRSVGHDVSVFTADRLDKKVLGIWSAGDVGLLLLMCDAQTPQELAIAEAKAKQDAAANKNAKKALRKHWRKPAKPGAAKDAAKAMTMPAAPSAPAAEQKAQAPLPAITPNAPSALAQPLLQPSTPAAAAPIAAVPPVPVPAAPPSNTGPSNTPPAAAPPVTDVKPADQKPTDQKPQVIPGAPPRDVAPPVTETPKPAAENPPAAFAPNAAPPAPAAPPASAPTSMKALPPPQMTPALATATSVIEQEAAQLKDKAQDKAAPAAAVPAAKP